MEYSRLIDNEMLASKLGFGGGPLSGEDWGPFNKKQNMMAVSRAYELGVNVFDTADVYGLGTSEKLLSKALGHNRHNVIISTKFGVNWGERPANGLAKTFYDSSSKRVVEALEASLKRLRLDCIPLYYIHWPDPNTSFLETAEALKRCQESGKIKNIGLSNFSLSQIKEIRQDLNVIAVQAQYSLIDKGIEGDFIDSCKDLGMNIFTYGPLAQGLLTGKYNDNPNEFFYSNKIFRAGDSALRTSSLGEARANALEKAQGDYVAFLDVDDILLPYMLEEQLNIFNNSTEALGFVYGRVEFFSEDNSSKYNYVFKEAKSLKSGEIFSDLCKENFIPWPSVLVSRKRLLECGGFPSDFYLSADYWIFVNMSRHFQVGVNQNVVCKARFHKNNLSDTQYVLGAKENIKIVERYLSYDGVKDSIKYQYVNLTFAYIKEKKYFKAN